MPTLFTSHKWRKLVSGKPVSMAILTTGITLEESTMAVGGCFLENMTESESI